MWWMECVSNTWGTLPQPLEVSLSTWSHGSLGPPADGAGGMGMCVESREGMVCTLGSPIAAADGGTGIPPPCDEKRSALEGLDAVRRKVPIQHGRSCDLSSPTKQLGVPGVCEVWLHTARGHLCHWGPGAPRRHAYTHLPGPVTSDRLITKWGWP